MFSSSETRYRPTYVRPTPATYTLAQHFVEGSRNALNHVFVTGDLRNCALLLPIADESNKALAAAGLLELEDLSQSALATSVGHTRAMGMMKYRGVV